MIHTHIRLSAQEGTNSVVSVRDLRACARSVRQAVSDSSQTVLVKFRLTLLHTDLSHSEVCVLLCKRDQNNTSAAHAKIIQFPGRFKKKTKNNKHTNNTVMCHPHTNHSRIHVLGDISLCSIICLFVCYLRKFFWPRWYRFFFLLLLKALLHREVNTN